MSPRAVSLILSILTTACGSSGTANVVVTPAPAGELAPSAPAGSAGCQTELTVGEVHTRAGCQIDERVSGQSALLMHACGDGLASATFGDVSFEGNVRAGQLDISIETTFDFSDGCTWRTKQRISGPLSSGDLAYSYEERPDRGQLNCARACVADAPVRTR